MSDPYYEIEYELGPRVGLALRCENQQLHRGHPLRYQFMADHWDRGDGFRYREYVTHDGMVWYGAILWQAVYHSHGVLHQQIKKFEKIFPD